MPIKPRIYQKVAVKAALKALRGPKRQALVVMATGLGKTLTAALIAKARRAKRTLFIVHNNFILKHAMEEFRLVFSEKTGMAIYNGLSKEDAFQADIVFSTWQTMGRNKRKWKRRHFDLIIVDESHHSEADTYKPTLMYFLGEKLAITATPDRIDKKDIRKIFGPEVINISLEEAIARGWLPRIEYHVITDQSLNNEVLQQISAEIQQGERRFTMREVNRRVFIRKRDEEIANLINTYNEKAIVFCSSIRHAKRMAMSLENASAFHSKNGKTSTRTWRKNQSILDDLKENIILRVCGVNALNEGVNVPSIGVVAFCRVTEASTIFRQQLGRGLRPGKDKLVVLDFVGNLERIQLVLEMMKRISELHEKYTPKKDMKREGYVRRRFELSGKGFEFTFSDQVVDLMKIIEHCDRAYYRTWQEAGAAARNLGIRGYTDYQRRYRSDGSLPGRPDLMYPGFPGWRVFLATGTRKRMANEIYSTCSRASAAAIRLGVTTLLEYKRMYMKDPHLPSCPDKAYKDFKDWYTFLGKKGKTRFKHQVYTSLQQSAMAARRLGITGVNDYVQRYKIDPKLPSNPWITYPDWDGWDNFLGRKGFYLTMQEAQIAARRLGITNRSTYKELYRKDPRLPSNPNRTYPSWKGWKEFIPRSTIVVIAMLILLSACSRLRENTNGLVAVSTFVRAVPAGKISNDRPFDAGLFLQPSEYAWKSFETGIDFDVMALDTFPDKTICCFVGRGYLLKLTCCDTGCIRLFTLNRRDSGYGTSHVRKLVDSSKEQFDSTLDKMRKGWIRN